jgi:hypothetical protein
VEACEEEAGVHGNVMYLPVSRTGAGVGRVSSESEIEVPC